MSYDITEVRANRTYRHREERNCFSTDENGRLIVDHEPVKVCKALLVNTSKPNLRKYNFAANNISLWEVGLYGNLLSMYSWYVQGALGEKHKRGKATLGFVHYGDIDYVTVIPAEKSTFALPTLVISCQEMAYAMQKSLPRLVLIAGADADLKRVSKTFLADFETYLEENPSSYAETLMPSLEALPKKARTHGLNL
ncbi:MAG: hypothetical protein LBO07_06350 [Coriobacteriales bacterium]|nr:hypothetical protein [Coriobacteriales bacterium]